MMQLMAIINAIALGWEVKEIDNKKFTMTKKINNMTELDKNTIRLLDTIMQFEPIQ